MLRESLEKIPIQDVLRFYSEVDEPTEEMIDFWTLGLNRYCIANQTFQIDSNKILEEFTIGGVIPASFKPSLPKLIDNKVLGLESDLTVKESNETSENLLVSIFSSVLSLSTTLLFPSDVFTKPIVETELLQTIMKIIIQESKNKETFETSLYLHTGDDFPLSFPKFLFSLSNKLSSNQKEEGLDMFLEGIAKSQQEMDLLIAFLEKQKYLKINRKENIIQFVIDNKQTSSELEVSKSKLQLQHSIYKINKKITNSEEKISKHLQLALQYKNAGNKSQALYQLQLKKLLTEQITQLIAAQSSLEEALHKLEGAEINKIILDAFEVASTGLKTSREQLSLDSVEDAIESFQTEMDEHKLINETLTNASEMSLEEEDSLQQELQELMELESLEKEEPQQTTYSVASTLPPAPTKPIRTSDQDTRTSRIPVPKRTMVSIS